MPIFRAKEGKVRQLATQGFESERALQRFFEANLDTLLGVRFVATEFYTGERHGGRIDTLGLDEAGSPVIIEYKWDKSDSVINQGLFYMDWLVDHKGDFELAAQKAIGAGTQVSWTAPRLVIVASTYTKYDTYAINQLGNIQLLRYQRYEDGTLFLDSPSEPLGVKPKKISRPGPTSSRPQSDEYGLEFHLSKTSTGAREAFLDLRERIMALEGVEERANQKSQITYRTTKSFAAFDFKKSFVQCQFKGGDRIQDPERRAKDIASYAWGYRWMCELRELSDVESVFSLIKGAYENEQ